MPRHPWHAVVPLVPCAVIMLLATGCGDSVAPERGGAGVPNFVEVGPQAAIRGVGTLGTGTATSGSDLQEFDFDVAADLTGPFFYRDWRFDATITVAATDPDTRITAFRDGSTTCEATGNGAEFDAIGRRETGALETFTVRACDDGAAGSGADFFSLSTTAEYNNAGRLSSGDIVKTVVESAPTTGTLVIMTATTGEHLPTTPYIATVTGPTSGSTPIEANDTLDFVVTAGTYTVTLSEVPLNCTVSDGTSRTVNVPGGGTGSTLFSINCTATTTTGTLTVITATTGENLPAGYHVSATNGTTLGPVPIGINETVSGSGIPAGEYSVTLHDVPTNCAVVNGTNPRPVTVPAGASISTTFEVSCTAITPTTADLTVSTTSSGSSIPSSYTVTVDGSLNKAIASMGGSVTFSSLAAGSHTVVLSVPSNCTVKDGATRTVTVPSGGTATASYWVSCVTPNTAPSVNAGADETVLLGALYTLAWSFSDPDNGPWSYKIEWGDGSYTTGSVSSPGKYYASHTYLLVGSYTIRVTVTDSRGASRSDTKVLTVLTNLGGILE